MEFDQIIKELEREIIALKNAKMKNAANLRVITKSATIANVDWKDKIKTTIRTSNGKNTLFMQCVDKLQGGDRWKVTSTVNIQENGVIITEWEFLQQEIYGSANLKFTVSCSSDFSLNVEKI